MKTDYDLTCQSDGPGNLKVAVADLNYLGRKFYSYKTKYEKVFRKYENLREKHEQILTAMREVSFMK